MKWTRQRCQEAPSTLAAAALDAAADPAIRRSVIDADKSLLHVSATRAKKRLFVSSSGNASELIAHLGVSTTANELAIKST